MLKYKEMLAFWAFFLLSYGYSFSQESVWRVEVSKLQCVVDNISSYKELGIEPVIITLETCPDVDLNAKIFSPLQSEPRNNQFKNQENGNFDTDDIIVLNVKELDCLSLYLKVNGGQIALIPKSGACPK